MFANVKHFFTSLGNEFFTSYGKQFFTLYGKDFFTLYGKQIFTSSGKEFFTFLSGGRQVRTSGKYIRVFQAVGFSPE